MSIKYEAPAITELGTIVEMTRAQGPGNLTDAAFPVGTPRDDVTFS
jgi:hypothetical protein